MIFMTIMDFIVVPISAIMVNKQTTKTLSYQHSFMSLLVPHMECWFLV